MPHPAPPWRTQSFATLPSTQDVAIEAARAGDPGPLAIIAALQTAGRGRAGRAWAAPEGNLNFSALIRPAPAPLLPAAWSLLAGLAIYEAAAAHLPHTFGLMLKWPNDLLLHGAKLAGVLIDSSLAADATLEWVVIGVGVNLATAPRIEGRATTSLATHGAAIQPETFATTLMAQLDRWRAMDFPTVRQAWLDRAHPTGTRLRVQRGEQVLEGEFLGLTQDGRLRLDGAGDAASGDVEIVGG